MPANVRFVPNEVGIELLRFSPAGAIRKDLHRRMRTLAFRARGSVGVDTGDLRARIQMGKIKRTPQGLEGRVEAPKKYATMHHEGTRPHPITPRRPGGTLRFKVAGKVVYAKRVNHPGTRPNKYLSRWLREAVK